MGVEYSLIDIEKREYYDLGKRLGPQTFDPVRAERSDRHQLKQYSSAEDLWQAFIEEWEPKDDDTKKYLRVIAHEVFAFLLEHPYAVLSDDCGSFSEEVEENWPSYRQVGTRYRGGAETTPARQWIRLMYRELYDVNCRLINFCDDAEGIICGESSPLAQEALKIVGSSKSLRHLQIEVSQVIDLLEDKLRKK